MCTNWTLFNTLLHRVISAVPAYITWGECKVWGPLFLSSASLSFTVVCVKVAQSCLTLCDPMNCSAPGSSVHGILQARTLEWVAVPFSRGSSRPRDRTQVSHITGGFFTIWATIAWAFLLYSWPEDTRLDEPTAHSIFLPFQSMFFWNLPFFF